MRTSKPMVHHLGQPLIPIGNERPQRRQRLFLLMAACLPVLAAAGCYQLEVRDLADCLTGLCAAALR